MYRSNVADDDMDIDNPETQTMTKSDEITLDVDSLKENFDSILSKILNK